MTDADWRERTDELAARYGLGAINGAYVGFEAACWSCGRPSPVFLWPGIKDWEDPPEPAPRTVRRRPSKTIGETYPANGCIHCDAMVGDWFLVGRLFDSLPYDEAGVLADRFLNDMASTDEST
jgi:hypothetical protein